MRNGNKFKKMIILFLPIIIISGCCIVDNNNVVHYQQTYEKNRESLEQSSDNFFKREVAQKTRGRFYCLDCSMMI